MDLNPDPSEFDLMLKGYGLSIVQMFYYMPDYPLVLNTFTWQFYDLEPDYPRMFEFIEFWQREVEGNLQGVKFSHSKMLGPSAWRHAVHEVDIGTGIIRDVQQ